MALYKRFMRSQILLIVVIASGILLFSSCKILQPNNMFRVPSDFKYSEFQSQEKEYTIKPFDKLGVTVTSNNGANLINVTGEGRSNQMASPIEYLVEFDGFVKLPSLGRIKIDGYSIREAEKELEKLYSNYYQDPFVYVKVTNRRIFVFGEGGSMGNIITLASENYTLIEALASIGGLSLDSKSYRIKLIRGDLSGNPEVFIFNIYNLKDIQKTNLLLQANDIIFIESKPRYVNKILSEVSPYLTLVTTALMVYGLFIK